MSKTYRCDCGDWSGEPCQWTGEAGDMVVVQWMPEHLRASHAAAGNNGNFPVNGARRTAVERSCADLMVETDGEWVLVIAEDTAAVEAAATEIEAHTLGMSDDCGGDENINA